MLGTFIPALKDPNANFSELEEQNLRRAAMEIMTLAALFIVSNLLMPGDDEDKNQIGGLR
jgi:hypothetical protein